MPLNEPTAADLAAMPLADLVDWRDACASDLNELEDDPRIVAAAARLRDAVTVISAKAGQIAQAVYDDEKKVSGTKTIKRDGLVIRGEISTKVTWDQQKLKALAGSLTWLEIEHLFKIEFSVSEAAFKALMPGAIKDALVSARTVKYGDLRVAVTRDAPAD